MGTCGESLQGFALRQLGRRYEMNVSVIIPTCDRPEMLKQAIESVLAQSRPAVEAIIVDNGHSPVEQESLPKSEAIKLIRALPRFGVSQARNLGAILARGQFLAFLDDDDAWDRDYLQGICECIETTGADVIIGRQRHMNTKLPRAGKQAEFESPQHLIAQILVRNPGVGGSNTVVARQVFARSRGYDPYLTTGQDKALVLDLLLTGATVARADAAWLDYRDDRTIPRQTELTKLMEGKRRFILKYWTEMSARQRARNLFNLSKMHLKSRMSFSKRKKC